MTDSHTASPQESALARTVTDKLAPATWITLVTVLVGWHAAAWSGLAWAVLGILFAAVIPLLVIKYGIRKDHWADRHLGAKKGRLVVMVAILVSVGVGIALLVGLDAPREVVALIATMLITLAVLAVITTVWKISVHQAVSAGAAIMLAQTYGSWMLLLYLLVGLVGWSRVALGDHTRGQALTGTLLGAVVAAASFALLR
ncbi:MULTISPECIES: hypothetical protein [Streptomyces]|uniref:Phosphatase PAP2 family protein n=1 Tax=Streptomyces reniochalinae TaxID=2250578 RepID=A0A367EB05_9ACTN|nr:MULTISPECIES: hypothetical protein [Streptomyces]RCG14912.1 hypothetical protein DQ392_28000 [Streptomyces reniochalinae]